MPMKTHEQFEVNADFMYAHIANTNGWDLSFNGQYNFKLQNSKIKPFGGAGLAIVSFNYDTGVAFQVFGGIGAEMSSGRAIRVQIRWILRDFTVTEILFGIAF
jgi:outer membrane protein W